MAEENAKKIGDKMPDGSIYAGISAVTNKPMYVSSHDQFAPLMSLSEAMEAAKEKDAHGHKDWRLPALVELSVLFNNRAATGVFNATNANQGGNYWTSPGGHSVYFASDPCKDGRHMHIWWSHGHGSNAVRFVRS
jgi:hypothetical protein